MIVNPSEPGWYLVDGMRRFWDGKQWQVAGQFRLDPGGQLPVWTQTELQPIAESMVLTLQAVPGKTIVEVHGIVTELTATSGWTATSKGNTSLDEAMLAIRRTAVMKFGANAIIGLQASMFGAAGGITNAFGGDAVGVLLSGTAVTVE